MRRRTNRRRSRRLAGRRGCAMRQSSRSSSCSFCCTPADTAKAIDPESTMDSVDLDVLRKCDEWLEAGHRVLLVTVVKTWGSSPRPDGAMLAVRDDGLAAGSVSGGCIEDDLIERMRREGMQQVTCDVVTYGVSADEARRFGLPCGGTIRLVLEPLTRESGIRELLRGIEAGRLTARRVDLRTGRSTLHTASATDGQTFDGDVLTTI